MPIEQRKNTSPHLPQSVFDASEADAIGRCSPGITAEERRSGGRINARVPLGAALATVFMLAGCVTVEESAQTAQPRDGGTYITGSRLPSRDSASSAPVGAVSKDDWQNIRRESGAAPDKQL